MPIFEYSCRDCGARFEKLLVSYDKKPGHCLQCGSDNLKKLFSPFSAAKSEPVSCCETGDCAAAMEGGCPGGSCGLG